MPLVADGLWHVLRFLPSIVARTTDVETRQRTLRTALDRANLVISPSMHLIREFARFGFDTARYQFIRQGLADLPRRTALTEAGSRPDGLRLGYAGQLKPHKGVDLVVEAVVRLIESGHVVSLDIWGAKDDAPEYVEALERRAGRLQAIRWRGAYQGNAWTALDAIDVLVVPSRWIENSPTIVLEAFAAGRPVVATDLGGMAELVSEGKNGLLFKIDDAASLRHQLERLIVEPGLLESLAAGVPPAKSIDEEMAEIVAEYERLVAARDGGHGGDVAPAATS
jgi:glycosyltransferase involved in cell wall biosynthesis